MHGRRRVWWGPLVAIAITLIALFALPSLAEASTSLPPGFQEQTVFSGLTLPTAVRFAPSPDSRVFVAEKRGTIQEYDSVDDVAPTQVIDLRQEVYNFSDRGLLGLAVDPGFPGRPYLYAMYTRDALPGGNVPHWGTPPYEDEDCAPGGIASTHCTVTGRLVKITINPATNVATNTETLIDDWCQEYLSHSIGDLRFGSDGQLYASGGDGADYDDGDYGQGTPANLCGDPINKDQFGTVLPTSEGGALRSLDLMTPNDPTSLDGAIIRIDPDTGAASAGNPVTTGDANAKRIVAYGLRNPFRFTFKPGSHEIWLGDVGWGDYEEVNRLDDPTAPGATVKNFGWPCYEGDALPGSKQQKVYKFYGISLCEQLYAQGPSAVVPPVYAYFHDHPDTDPSACALVRAGNVTAFKAGSSVTGMTFYENPATNGYGAAYQGGLFFGDYARGCIWYMAPDDEGDPDPSQITTFAEGASYPVDLQIGPGGDLFYASIGAGDVRRIRHSDLAVSLNADQTHGAAPLPVAFSTNVTGANGHALTYSWDLNGDGVYGNDGGGTGPSAGRSYDEPNPRQVVKVRVRVTDTVTNAAVTSAPVLIAPGDITLPTAHIDTPSPSLAWTVGQSIPFSGGGTDADEPGGATDQARTSWELILQHCPGGCHQHYVRSYAGVGSGSFTGVQHEYPSHLTLRLTVTDEYGMTDTTSIDLNPQTAKLTVLSDPAGLSAAVNLESGATPVTATLMKGATVTVATPQSQVLGGRTYTFTGWSDGGDRVHGVKVDSDTTLTAHFSTPGDPTPPPAPGDTSGLPVPALPGTPATPAATPKVRRGPSVKVGSRGIAALPVTCASAKPCSVAVTLRPFAGGVVLGRGSVKLAARRKGVVRVALSAAARRTLARKGRLDAVRTVVLRTAGKPAATDLVRFTLLRAR